MSITGPIIYVSLAICKQIFEKNKTSWGWAGTSSVPAYLAMPDGQTVFI